MDVPPEEIREVAQSDPKFAELCRSGTLWRNLYTRTFGNYTKDEIKWRDQFKMRHEITQNIKKENPRRHVQSFLTNNSRTIRMYENAIAYDTWNEQSGSSRNRATNMKGEVRVVTYDYRGDECYYRATNSIKIEATDFVFIDRWTILVAERDKLSVIDLKHPEEADWIKVDLRVASGMICPISMNLFAVIGDVSCSVYDVRSGRVSQKSGFRVAGRVIGACGEHRVLYVATSETLTAYNIGSALGTILWSYTNVEKTASFCAFSVKTGRVLHGNRVMDLAKGVELNTVPGARAVCGEIVEPGIAVVGCSDKTVVFYDFIGNNVIAVDQGVTNEVPRAIRAGPNGVVAVADNYVIRLFSISGERVNFTTTLAAGSRNLPKQVEDVMFDGERCVIRTDQFVRIYDFSRSIKKIK